jgi:hypothetical protein
VKQLRIHRAATWPWMLATGGTVMAALVGIWVLQRVDANVAGNPLPRCPFYLLTGYHCIGCGLTRALHALVHGQFARAFGMNPLAMTMLPLLPLMLAWGRGWQPRPLQPLMRWVLEPKLWLWLLPGYWVARNLPWPPFSWLAPG